MVYVPPIPFDYNALNQGLAAIFDVACSLPGSATGGTAQDADQAFYFPSNDPADGSTLAKITYNIISVQPKGCDEWRVGYDPTVVIPGDTYIDPVTHEPKGGAVYSAEGQRRLTVSIKCECWDMTGAGAIQYLERIRTRLSLPSFIAALRALKCAQSSITNTRTLNYTDDNSRRVSAAQFDMWLNIADAAVDTPVTSIEILGKPTAHITP